MRIFCLALFLAVVVRAQDLLLWGSLEPGPHPVGFRSFILLDESRKYDGEGRRPILFAVWYPASDVREAGMEYAGYLHVPDVAAHPLFRGRMERFVSDTLAESLFNKWPDIDRTRLPADKLISALANAPSPVLSREERDAMDKLLATRTHAHRDAPQLTGRFPVILNHPGAGGPFQDNSVLCEYVASYGYVVVSSAFESPYPSVVASNIGDLEMFIADLAFMARETQGWPYADPGKFGAIGHSIGAQNLLRWVGHRKCPVKAFVSLDTTMEYATESDKRWAYMRIAMRKLTPPRIPMVLFAQARLKPNFSVFDRYLYRSPHYEAEAAELNHLEFVTQGVVGRVLMHEPQADAVRRSYEEVCRTILRFLDATLKSDPQAAKSLMRADPASPVAVRYKTVR
jgi:hypothetical protein